MTTKPHIEKQIIRRLCIIDLHVINAVIYLALLSIMPSFANEVAQKAESKNEKSKLVLVKIQGLDDPKDKALKTNAQNSLTIGGLKKSPPIDLDRLNWFYHLGNSEIKFALEPFGYYQSQISGSLLKQKGDWIATYEIAKGTPVKLNRVLIQVEGEADDNRPLIRAVKRANNRLKKGEILNHQTYEEIKEELIQIAQSQGYIESEYKENVIYINFSQNTADIILRLKTGSRYYLGDITFTNPKFDHNFLQRFVPFFKGDPYLDESLLTLQGNLVSSNYFGDVLVTTNPIIGQYQVPVVVDLKERKRIQRTTGIGYSTDMGVRLRGDIEWRYVNKRGHKFKVGSVLSRKKREFNMVYTIPGKKPLQDKYEIYTNFEVDKVKNGGYRTSILGFAWVKQRGKLTHRHSLEYRYDEFKPTGDNKKIKIKLIMPTIAYSWRNYDRISFRDNMIQFNGMVRGAAENLFSDLTFIQTRWLMKYHLPFMKDHRFIARAEAGLTFFPNNADFAHFPTSLRFYAGGDNSVRGYALDAIGSLGKNPSVYDQQLTSGGKKLLIGSLEYEYRFKKDISAAVFVDAGDVFNHNKWNPKVGFGVGGRWYSPIGAIRVDIAHGADKKVGDKFRFHLTIETNL